jgi:hypothetical protein
VRAVCYRLAVALLSSGGIAPVRRGACAADFEKSIRPEVNPLIRQDVRKPTVGAPGLGDRPRALA